MMSAFDAVHLNNCTKTLRREITDEEEKQKQPSNLSNNKIYIERLKLI